MAKASKRTDEQPQPPAVEAVDVTMTGDDVKKSASQQEIDLKERTADAATKQADLLKHTITTDQGKVMGFATCPRDEPRAFLPKRPRFDAHDAQSLTRAYRESVGLEPELSSALEQIKAESIKGENRLVFQCKPNLSCYEGVKKELQLLHFEVSGPSQDAHGRTCLSISWPK